MKTLNSVNRKWLLMPVVLCFFNIAYAWSANGDIEAVANSSFPGWIKIIIIVLLVLCGGGALLYLSINKHGGKNTTAGEHSPATDAHTEGNNSPAQVFNGSNNNANSNNNNATNSNNTTTTNINLHVPQPAVPVTKSAFELDRQTLTGLFSCFSTLLMDDFLKGPDPTYIDYRIYIIHDYWSDYINSTTCTFQDSQTQRVILDFFEPFDKLIAQCLRCYERSSNPHKFHIRGMIGDSFDDRIEDEKKFDENIALRKALEAPYVSMVKFVQLTYKLDLQNLSQSFINQHPE